MQRNPNVTVVGVSGYAGSGKDFLAQLMGEKLANVHRYAFADPIKNFVNAQFGWSERHSFGDLKEEIDPFWGFSPRMAYQKFGTEYGRALADDIWLRFAQKEYERIAAIGGDHQIMVIPDVRFKNESNWVKERGITVSVVRTWIRPNVGFVEHESEQNIDELDLSSDYRIINPFDERYNDRVAIFCDWLMERINGKF